MTLTPTSHHITSQRLELHYSDWGNGGAPPLILIHGLRDHGRAWDPVARELSRDWHVIAPDLRGHGESAWTSDGTYAMSGFVFDLAALVDALELRDVPCIGHSLGGNISLRYAAAFPETISRLVVIEGIGAAPDIAAKADAVPVSEKMRAWIEKRKKLLGRTPRVFTTLEEATDLYHKALPHLTRDLAAHLTRHGTRPYEDGLTWKYDPLLPSMIPEDFSQPQKNTMMGEIQAPTLLIYGDDSWASNPQNDGRMDHFKDVRLETFPGAGHWVHHDAPEKFVQSVTNFLQA